MYKWLSYSPDKVPVGDESNEFFYNWEFSFTLEGDMKQEIYCRYECFKNPAELKSRLIDWKPIKIDIGAVYNVPPKQHSTIANIGQGFIP